MSHQDAISLTRTLLRFDTINPPGRERDCAKHAGALLQDWGFKVDYFEYEEKRTSIVARAGGSDKKSPLCLTGHLDVVPLGSRAWTKHPFAGETDGDRLYGRGSSDMKAGIAAILLALKGLSKTLTNTPGIIAVLTAAEEGGCIGSYHLAQPQLGVNAIYEASRAILKMEKFDFGVPAHAVMGKPTLNVGTIEGGNAVNSVPDAASVGVDIRTVPGMDHQA